MRKLILLSIALFCYGDNLNNTLIKAYENSPKIKKLQNKINYLSDDVKLSGLFDNPTLKLGINDILLNKPLDRNLEPMQTQYVAISQKFPINSKLTLKESIAIEKLNLSKLKLIKLKINLKNQIENIFLKISKLSEDLIIVDKYKNIIDESYNLHTIYNLTPQTHYKKAINSKILLTKLKLKESNRKKKIKILKAKLKEIISIDILMKNLKLKINEDKKKKAKLNKLKEIVLKDNIELILKSKEIDILTHKLKLTKSQKIPDISLSVGYYERDDREDYLSFGLSMPLPIYKREDIKISKNLKEINIKKNELYEIKNRVIFELKEAYLNMQSAKEEFYLIKESLDYQNELLDSLVNQAETKSNLMPVYEILKELFESEFNLNSKIYEYNLAKSKIERLKGKL